MCDIKAKLQDCRSDWNTMTTAKLNGGGTNEKRSLDVGAPERRLKHQLKHVYDQIAIIVDFKAATLLAVQRICDSYTSSITSIGQYNGVLQAEKKVAMVTSPHFLPLTGNRFFSTEEVLHL